MKLNKLLRSKLGVVFGIKGKHHGAVIFHGIAELPKFAVLIGKGEIGSDLTGSGRRGFDIRSRGSGHHEKKKKNQQERNTRRKQFSFRAITN